MQRNLLCQKEGFPLRVCKKKGGGGIGPRLCRKKGDCTDFLLKKMGVPLGRLCEKKEIAARVRKKKMELHRRYVQKKGIPERLCPKKVGFPLKSEEKKLFSVIIRHYKMI